MAEELVTLNNGKTVTLDEFLSWSQQKQTANVTDLPQSDQKRAKLSAIKRGIKTGPLAQQTKDKISAALKGTKHGVPVSKVMTPKGLFNSREEAAIGCGVGRDALRRYIKNKPTEYYLIPPTALQPLPPVFPAETSIVIETFFDSSDKDAKPPFWFLNFNHSFMKWQNSTKYQLNQTIPFADAVVQRADEFCKSLGLNVCVREVQISEFCSPNTVCHLFVFQNNAERSSFMMKYA